MIDSSISAYRGIGITGAWHQNKGKAETSLRRHFLTAKNVTPIDRGIGPEEEDPNKRG